MVHHPVLPILPILAHHHHHYDSNSSIVAPILLLKGIDGNCYRIEKGLESLPDGWLKCVHRWNGSCKPIFINETTHEMLVDKIPIRDDTLPQSWSAFYCTKNKHIYYKHTSTQKRTMNRKDIPIHLLSKTFNKFEWKTLTLHTYHQIWYPEDIYHASSDPDYQRENRKRCNYLYKLYCERKRQFVFDQNTGEFTSL